MKTDQNKDLKTRVIAESKDGKNQLIEDVKTGKKYFVEFNLGDETSKWFEIESSATPFCSPTWGMDL